MDYDVVVIGGGLSGLTAGSLLAKRHLKVAVIDKNQKPGGSCGIFKKGSVTFEQGSAMLYGFGEYGFNAHRFVFNCLEEPIDIIRHDLLYCVNYNGKRIRFWPDINKFVDELGMVFPKEKNNIRRFYRNMEKLYRHIMVELPSYNTADETDPKTALRSIKKHPLSYIKFLGLLNKSAEALLRKYFKDPDIFNFFDKLTSTYCYATVKEAPAVLAAVMFVDNHIGGSYYPAGSTMFLTGKLEKVIEENDGDMILGRKAISILFKDNKPSGVLLDDGSIINAKQIIYSGTVWNLYGKLIDPIYSSVRKRNWSVKQIPTYPSVVFYCVVDRSIIPEDTSPIEMIVSSPDKIDENEITAYILSIDDRTLCGENEHVITAIGPSFEKWENLNATTYAKMKSIEVTRITEILEKRFPGFSGAIKYSTLATPLTLERYTMKNGGAVAGPKQMLGQHMFRRLHTRTEWNNLFCCGESTVMGTGTPTVTTSGISAANAILKIYGKEPFVYIKDQNNYVRITDKPFTSDMLYESFAEPEKSIMRNANKCRFCENPSCSRGYETDIPGIMRRLAVGNLIGAKRYWNSAPVDAAQLKHYEDNCICALEGGNAIPIREIISFIDGGSI